VPIAIQSEIFARLGVVVEEIDETVLWLELIADSEIVSQERLKELQREANELLAIFVASQLTAKGITPNSSIRKSVNP
jgi:four helix bundle protein